MLGVGMLFDSLGPFDTIAMLRASPQEINRAVDDLGDIPAHLSREQQFGRVRVRLAELRDVDTTCRQPALWLRREHQDAGQRRHHHSINIKETRELPKIVERLWGALIATTLLRDQDMPTDGCHIKIVKCYSNDWLAIGDECDV